MPPASCAAFIDVPTEEEEGGQGWKPLVAFVNAVLTVVNVNYYEATLNIVTVFLPVQLSELLCLALLHRLRPEGHEALTSGECE